MENAQPEPSMEEILASIRRIISEDEEEAPKGEASKSPEEEASPAVAPAPAQPASTESDRTELHLETEDVEMIKKSVAEAVEHETGDAMLDEGAATAASSAFDNLSASVRVSDGPGRTLEQLVVDMLKPMVKEWLDANLPAIVEDKVEEEVQRVARRRR